ncbi:MAG: cobalamin biosynthesis protein CbiD [Dialister sp.]|uniref:cobalt-precorrin-5B (C(1))-methyltransferase CbiD n=1 Tax=Dialister sp. TaxID=1955814 RepID=UPI00257AA6FA|nr:cobalt-precorrin-5B (C(1))-methyltransferase CbiD [Dialister sp.]MBS6295829.1 cobalamin biosynthesis protein CbiD [Dialister sp.]
MNTEEMMRKVLREGYTTGATATVAMKAAVLAIKGEFPKQVTVLSPQRTEITLPVQSASAENNIGTATVLKDAGDDLDCTNGTPIVVTVELTDKSGMELRAGKGVGTVTRPGLQVQVGRPAINPGPQIMLRYVYEELIAPAHGCIVTISIPKGEELAKQTLNPALGVVGGISVLGTTGIVKPMSEDAYKRSLAPQVPVVWASGIRTATLCPGRIGEHAAQIMGIPKESIIETSNYIGYMMEQCVAKGFEKMLLIGHMGKLVKVASGSFHTYNRNSDGRMETMAAYAAMNGAAPAIVREIMECNTTDGAALIIAREGYDMIYGQMAERAQVRAERYIFGKARVGIVFAGLDGTVQAVSSRAKEILEEGKWNIH